jgi:Flp pilus assembly CpaF family ATPase
MNSLHGQAGAPPEGARPEARAVGPVFPLDEDPQRSPQMREAWAAFGREMSGAVRSALDSGRSPPEIAYAVGEIVHNYFRTRGLTLTSYELRRLVGELLDSNDRSKPAPAAPLEKKENERLTAELVSFVGKPAPSNAPAWGDDERAAPKLVVPEEVLEVPPSKLVNLIGREAASFDRLLTKVVALASPKLEPMAGGRINRARAFAIVDEAIEEVLRVEQSILPANVRERLALLAVGDICGLGPIDRLWSDRSVRAVFVDGPQKVYVEREAGRRELASEGFRDEAHLLRLARRLANVSGRRTAPSGVHPESIVELQLRDGGSGTVIFPPAAPGGPVLVLRRGEPGLATLQRLVASELIDRRIAGLLRIAARTSLNVLVAGPEGSGKTALLAAIVRDQSAMRIITLARHREFRWPSLDKVELVALPGPDDPSYASLLAAAERLQPEMLVLDSVRVEEVLALVERLSRGGRGTFAVVESEALAAALARSFDIFVRLGRSHDGVFRALALEDATGAEVFVHDGGQFHCKTAQPSFAASVSAAGYGEALRGVLR